MDFFDDIAILTDEVASFKDIRGIMDFRPNRHRPSQSDIEDQNQFMLERQKHFRIAAEYVAQELAQIATVTKVVLFGSVAVPLKKEIPRFREYRRAKVEVWHECSDVDLAIWVNDLTDLKRLQHARSQGLNQLQTERDIGVAHHQVDIFLMEPNTNRYLGRLCCYGQCPKGKPDCRIPGCGVQKLLQQHEEFTLKADALSDNRTILLYDAKHPNDSNQEFEEASF